MAQLSGTGSLADDLYLLAHNEVTGRPHLQPRAAGMGLAGALLAELILSGTICLQSGRIGLAGGTPPGGWLARAVLGLLAGVAPLTVAAGVIPIACATTGLTGIPAAFLAVAVILALATWRWPGT